MERSIILLILGLLWSSLMSGQNGPSDLIDNNINDSNVIWHSPSKNSLGSMPTGNGDIGINLWVEENGDLLFYLSKTDAWSENCRLLKLGKIRVALSPNPFKTSHPFLQELVLKDGLIKIEAGEEAEKLSMTIWVDANHPVVEVDVVSENPTIAKVSTEPWRTERRKMDNPTEIPSAYGLHGKGALVVFVEKDTVLLNKGNQVIWAHRNERSIWQDNLKLQGLGNYSTTNKDPLLQRTFGGLITSKELKKDNSTTISSPKTLKSFSVSIYALSAQTESLDSWENQLTNLSNEIGLKSRHERLNKHKAWWYSFWNRSYISISTKDESEKENVFNINRGYNLQRFINACSGRGNSPIKFNGSIFTVDTKNLEVKEQGFDADYRRWGGPYWWQNTRLPYWSMLESGDFDLMLPLFKMYKDALPIRKLATSTYYGHKGAFFPETQYFWGTYVDANYGRDRSELALGLTENRYIRHYWQSGLELSLMMLDYYHFTKNDVFLKETLLPIVSEIIHFYDVHWQRDINGKILFDPAMALETYNTAVNPLPEIVGINKVCLELLRLPKQKISQKQKNQWQRLIGELPEIPTRELKGEVLLAPAQEYSGKQNIENPELYAIFPYRAYGIGKSNLEIARNTFKNRAIKETGGWQQNAIKAAYLGLIDEASTLTTINFNSSNKAYRFPAMWGPNYDWTPDQDHGCVALIALQRMLLQYDKDDIFLLPAWPIKWDAKFKLHAPNNTIIEGYVINGSLKDMSTYPNARKKDIKLYNAE